MRKVFKLLVTLLLLLAMGLTGCAKVAKEEPKG